MKVVIIEDEEHTAKDLAQCITKAEPSAQVIAILSSVKEAIAYFKENADPDLIFSDIQLGDGLSFTIFDSNGRNIPVVFCTAYDEYALSAFNSAGIDYILKPFTTKSIAGALAKYGEFRERLVRTIPSYGDLGTVYAGMQQKRSVLVFHRDKIIPVKMEGIALFWLQNEIVHLITFDKQRYIISNHLEELEKIGSGRFYRVNRQYLVSHRAIRDAAKYFGRKLLINLTIPFDEKITVGKLKVNHFLAWLSGC
jgi:two-component system response regulator LytT